MIYFFCFRSPISTAHFLRFSVLYSFLLLRRWAGQPDLVFISFACMKLSSSEIFFSLCASVIFLRTDSSCPICFGSLNLVLVCHPLGSVCENGARWGNPGSAPNPTVFNEERLGTYRVNQREIERKAERQRGYTSYSGHPSPWQLPIIRSIIHTLISTACRGWVY